MRFVWKRALNLGDPDGVDASSEVSIRCLQAPKRRTEHHVYDARVIETLGSFIAEVDLQKQGTIAQTEVDCAP
jgi:hypothetical protein